jgi:hypothetical protein
VASQHERRFQPKPLSNAPPVSSGDFTQVRITRVNARGPMNRADQRLVLLIWVSSACAALLVTSEVCRAVYLACMAIFAP